MSGMTGAESYVSNFGIFVDKVLATVEVAGNSWQGSGKALARARESAGVAV